jgi:TolA-binding protein
MVVRGESMRYSAFEEAAAEATAGMKEVESRLEQLMGEVDQLKGKRELLRGLAHQLNILRAEGINGAPADSAPQAAVEAKKPDLPVAANEPASSTSSSARGGWFTRASDSGASAGDSTIRGRL